MKLIKKSLLFLYFSFWLLQPEASAQNTTRLLIGEWYFVNEEKDKLDLNNVLTFSLEGVYTYQIAGLQGVGYWELSKNKQYLLIRDFRYTHLPKNPPERFKLFIEYIDESLLVLSRHIKNKKIKTKYRRL